MKTVDYLDALKAAYSLDSDYQLTKKLGESSARISQYRTGRNIMDDDFALKVSYLLDLNPLAVLADAHIEREMKRGNNSLVIFWEEVKRSGKMDVQVLTKMVA